MNYSYFRFYTDVLTSPRDKFKFQTENYNNLPFYFAYGKQKDFMFHSTAWIKRLEKISREDGKCKVKSFDCDHWIMVHKAAEYTYSLFKWLEDTN